MKPEDGALIAKSVRHEQHRIIKYNHLVASLVILHNVNAMTTALNELKDEGFGITEALVAELVPYEPFKPIRGLLAGSEPGN